MSLQNTHTFKLASGVECEVLELTGKHQELLTIQSNKNHTDRLNELLADRIVRVGSEHSIDVKFVEKMLAGDKKLALVEIRQFTLGFQDEFSFVFDYVDDSGKKRQHTETVTLEDGGKFPAKPMMVVGKVDVDGELVDGLVPADFSEYEQVLAHKVVSMKLPRSGTEINFTMLDGKGELIGANTSKKDRSSHTLLRMRQPVYFEQKETDKGVVPIQLDPNRLGLLDVEALRARIREVEPDVDTLVMFENPDTGKTESVDVLSTVAFFFPSGVL